MADDFTALRDHFAEVAMRELLKQPPPTTHPVTDWGKHMGSVCYYLADAMIEARNKK
jgi:hypothetical protein